MDELIDKLVEQVGIDRETAQKVVSFLKENAADIPKWLGSEAGQSVLGKLSGGLGGLFGNK